MATWDLGDSLYLQIFRFQNFHYEQFDNTIAVAAITADSLSYAKQKPSPLMAN